MIAKSYTVALFCVSVFRLFNSSLWLFVSKFTDLTPNRLHKVYKHMVKKRSEHQQLNKVLLLFSTNLFLSLIFILHVLWHCRLGGSKGIWSVKNWVVRCWRGYLSGARCWFAYGPANATASYYLFLH